MSADAKRSASSTVILILLGMAALYGGTKWLVLLIPAAGLIWFAVRPMLGSSRN